MSRIDVSIWGIRAGFEENGIFHSHNFADVKELQKDKFRGLADLSRPKNSYMINRTGAHTVVTIIHTDIFEFSVSGAPRSGYIAISLIFDKNKALASSPKSFLQQFVQWYKQVQGNTRVNNFTAEQIQGIVNQLTLVDSVLRDVPGKKAIAYSNETELDENLTGGSKYVPFEETIFYDSTINFGQCGLKNEVIPMSIVIGTVEKEEEKRRIEEEQSRVKQQQIAEKERDLLELKKLGQIDQMIETFDKFQFNFSLSPALRNEIETIKQRRAEAIQSQEELRKAEEISRLIKEENYELACVKFDILKDRSRLTANEQRIIQLHKDDVRRIKIQEQKEREKAENSARKKKAIKIYSFVGIFVLLVGLSVFSFILEIPLSLYDTDGDKIANSEDKCPEIYGTKNGCPDKDGDDVIDSEDDCPDEKGELNGCPDADGDGLSDKYEIEKGTDRKKADTDGDGVNDKEDNCPLEKGTTENKGCKVETVNGAPADKKNDEIINIKYKNKEYSIKKGFTTKGGMKYNNSGWRYYNNKWEKEATIGSGNWGSSTDSDIEVILGKFAKEIKKTNQTSNPTTSEIGNAETKPKAVSPRTAVVDNGSKKTISKENRDKLKQLYDDFKDKSTLTTEEKKKWDNLYKELYKSANVTEDNSIKDWNYTINNIRIN
jgi:hypothetical protein